MTHILAANSTSRDLEMSPAHSGVQCSKRVVSQEKMKSKGILDYLAASVINKQQKDNTTKSSHSTYSNIVSLFKPAYPWLTSNILRVYVHRYRKKLQVISKQQDRITNQTCDISSTTININQSLNELTHDPPIQSININPNSIAAQPIILSLHER